MLRNFSLEFVEVDAVGSTARCNKGSDNFQTKLQSKQAAYATLI